MKFILYSFILLLIITLCVAVYGSFWLKNNTSLKVSDFFNKDGEVEIDKDAKGEIKEKAKKLDNRIYKEATEHNPEGDVLPDEIDDTIREKIKEEAKDRIN